MPDTAALPESLRPYDARMLSVGDGHWLYVEEVGRRDGYPALFLHGGPGSGSQHMHRRIFDPERHRAILFDQRGAGRSHPPLSLTANTTDHLVADIEAIRTHFAIERWIIAGGSWGSTLALAYAERHPERVAGLVLRAVFLATDAEVRWAFVDGPKTFRPDLYADFVARLPEAERGDPLAAYLARIGHPDRAVHFPAAQTWHDYERALSELTPASGARLPPLPACTQGRLPPTPVIEAHYIRNQFFLNDGALLAGGGALAAIPGTIVQGRYDLLCPPANAYALAAAWAAADLQLVDAAGHAMTEADVIERMRRAVAALTPR
jgi:proline iminopeptidase